MQPDITRDIDYNLRLLLQGVYTVCYRNIEIDCPAFLSVWRNTATKYILPDTFRESQYFNPPNLYPWVFFFIIQLHQPMNCQHSFHYAFNGSPQRQVLQNMATLRSLIRQQIKAPPREANRHNSLHIIHQSIKASETLIQFSFLWYTAAEISRASFQPSSHNRSDPHPCNSNSQSSIHKTS